MKRVNSVLSFLKFDSVFFESVYLLMIFGILFPLYHIIYDKFYYIGYFRYDGINEERFIIGIVLALFFILLNNRIYNNFLKITYSICLIMFYFGEICLYVCDKQVDLTMVIIFSVFLLCVMGIDKIKLKTSYFNTNKDTTKILLIITVLVFLPYLRYLNFVNINNLLFIDIYETRSEFQVLGMPTVLAYLYGILTRVMIPVLIIEFYKRKNIIITVLLSVMLAYLFLCGALKSVFIGLLSVFFFYSGSYEIKRKRFIFSILIAEILALLLYFHIDNVFLINIFRRVYFIAARFNNYYIEFFRDNWTYYSHSGLAFWADKTWLGGLDISHWAGKYVLGTNTNANTGIFVEGYYSFGLIGALIYLLVPIFILLFLKSIDYKPEYYGIIFMYLYYFNTSILSTMLITHGLLLFLIISYFHLRLGERPLS